MVALRASDVNTFLSRLIKSRESYRVFLCYGPDGGHVASVAERLLNYYKQEAPIITVEGESLLATPQRLVEETHNLGLFQSCRVVRLPSRGYDKATTKALSFYLEQASPLVPVVVEGGNLERSSSLRLLCERSPDAVTLPCYPDDGKTLIGLASSFFQKEKILCDREVYPLLASVLGADRRSTESELEKLACYAATSKRLTVDDVTPLVSDTIILFADSIVDHAYRGDISPLTGDFFRFCAQGHTPHILVTSALQHGFFLINELSGTSQIHKTHFKRRPSLEVHKRLWTLASLTHAVSSLAKAQLYLRETAMPLDLTQAFIHTHLFTLIDYVHSKSACLS